MKFIERCTFPLVSVVLIFSLCLCRAAAGVQSADDRQIRAVITAFLAALESKDVDRLMTFWSKKPSDLASTRKEFERTFASVDHIRLDAVAVRKLEISQDRAVALVYAETSAVNEKTGKAADGFGKINQLIEFAREDGVWRVSRYVSAEQDLAARIAGAKTSEDREALLDTNRDLITLELDRCLLAEANKVLQGDYQQALDLLQLAEHSASAVNDEKGMASILATIGDLQENHGIYKQAIEPFLRSIALFERLGNRTGLAFAVNGLGTAYNGLGDYEMALKNYHRSLEITRALSDKQRIARALNNIGMVEIEQSDYAEAMKCYEESLSIEEAAGDTAAVATILQGMGIAETDQGNYSRALSLLGKSQVMAEKAARPVLVSGALFNTARVHSFQGNLPQAIEHYERALELAEKSNDQQVAAYCLVGLGTVERMERHYAEAEAFLRRGLKVAEGFGGKAIIAVALSNIGGVKREQGKNSESLEYFQKAMKLEEELSDKADTAGTLTEIAETYIALGKYTLALDAAGRAAQLAEKVGFLAYMFDALSSQASAYRALGSIDRARDTLAKAISASEALRSSLGDSAQEREPFLERTVAPYHAMSDILLDQGSTAEAFNYSERSKARTLTDVLESGKVDLAPALTADEKGRERDLNVKLASINTQLLNERLRDRPDQSRVADLESRLGKARLEREAFEAGLYASHPEVKVQRGEFQPLSLKDCSELIPDSHTAILEFLVSKDRTDVFVLSKSDIKEDVPRLKACSIKLKETELTDLIDRFHKSVAERDPTFSELSTELYDLLLKPLSRDLSGKSSLIIVPDQALWDLPFQALQSARNHFLIEDYAVSYAPSLTALREMSRLKRLRRAKQLQLLAFANPLVSDETSTGVRETFMYASLQPLPQAETQVRFLAQLFGSRQSEVYVGQNATEDRLKAEARAYRELYIAAHGIVNNASPMYSQILLSKAQGSKDDGILEAWEVANMDVKADLAVLAACSTAGGKAAPGEGMIGLSWAFFIAGCPTTMASQWDVDADSTTKLMIEFHRQMLAGKTKAEALRQAELKLLKRTEYSHPFYWAPFTIVGDNL